MHLWHDLKLRTDNGDFRAVIEIAAGTCTKYEVDKTYGLLRLDRVLHGALRYPVNYGIFPCTLEEDGDPLDALVLCSESIQPGTIAVVRVLGLMHMTDQGINDHKVLCAVARDPGVNQYKTIDDFPENMRLEYAHFFETYTDLENKNVTIPGWGSREEGLSVIEQAKGRYDTMYTNS